MVSAVDTDLAVAMVEAGAVIDPDAQLTSRSAIPPASVVNASSASSGSMTMGAKWPLDSIGGPSC